METDEKFRIGHMIYADAEARVYLPYLETGPLPDTGTWTFVPRFGIERGTTMHGRDTARVEDDAPTRFKWGANASVSWPEKALRLVPGGLRLEADLVYRSIDAREDASRKIPARPLYWTAQAAITMTPNFALTFTRRSGRMPPLFLHQSAWEFGATLIR
jgi:hypothetical protein